MWLNQHHQHPPICVFHNILLSYVIGITLFVCCWLVVIDCQPPLAVVAPQQYNIRTTTEHDSQERQSTTTTTTSQRAIDQNRRNDIPNDEYYVGIASHDM